VSEGCAGPDKSIKINILQEGWEHFRSSFYYISSTMKTWQKSRDDCLSRGADLTIVDSREEQDFLRRNSKAMWIGLTDRVEDTTWRWVDGTLLNTSYWYDGEPNNYPNEDCAEVTTRNEENNWNDARCDRRKYWVCEKKVAP
uniref:C-type lectin domain-containing protein n=1 Tax=Salarias fasciatus TaxID=181472 RepID=A0A672HW66_SALFA